MARRFGDPCPDNALCMTVYVCISACVQDVGTQVQAQLLPSNARVAASVMDAIGKNIRLPTFPKPEHEGHRKVCCHSRASP